MVRIFFFNIVKYFIIAFVGAAFVMGFLAIDVNILITAAISAVVADVIATVICFKIGYSERNLLYLCAKKYGTKIGVLAIAAAYCTIIGGLAYMGKFPEAMGMIIIVNGYGAIHNVSHIIKDKRNEMRIRELQK